MQDNTESSKPSSSTQIRPEKKINNTREQERESDASSQNKIKNTTKKTKCGAGDMDLLFFSNQD